CLLQLFSRHRRGDELLAIDPHRATSSGLYARTTCRSEQGSYASPLDESLSQSFGVVHVSSLLWKGGISGSTLGALAHRVIHQDNGEQCLGDGRGTYAHAGIVPAESLHCSWVSLYRH